MSVVLAVLALAPLAVGLGLLAVWAAGLVLRPRRKRLVPLDGPCTPRERGWLRWPFLAGDVDEVWR